MVRVFISLGLILFLLNSCIGYYPKEIFTPLGNELANCTKNDTIVDLFFDGEPITFEYEKVGLIEVQGANFDKDIDVINVLKELANEKCCDAVIGIKKEYLQREAGLVFENEHESTYKSISYYGIGVKRK